MISDGYELYCLDIVRSGQLNGASASPGLLCGCEDVLRTREPAEVVQLPTVDSAKN